MNAYIKDYFQEWLDINALNTFRQTIKPETKLKEDWLNLSGQSYQMKFYSSNSVNLMSNIIMKKWIHTQQNADNSLKNKNFVQFKTFKHTHPFILQLFDFITRIYTKIKNPAQE